MCIEDWKAIKVTKEERDYGLWKPTEIKKCTAGKN